MLRKDIIHRHFLTIGLIILLNNVQATPLRKLIGESENIVVGLVMKTETIRDGIRDSKATVQIDTILKGEFKKAIIGVYFCSAGLHSPPCEYLTTGQMVLLFLNSSDSIYSINSHFGAINLDNKTKTLYLDQIGKYLKIEKKKNNPKIIEWLISGISASAEFSYLCSDLYEFKNDLTSEQKKVLLKILYSSDTIPKSSFFKKTDPYLVLDYFQIASILGKQYSSETTAFLLPKLQESTSAYLARGIMMEIYFVNKDGALKELLSEYDKKQENNNSDSIIKESELIIDKFINETNDRKH